MPAFAPKRECGATGEQGGYPVYRPVLFVHNAFKHSSQKSGKLESPTQNRRKLGKNIRSRIHASYNIREIQAKTASSGQYYSSYDTCDL